MPTTITSDSADYTTYRAIPLTHVWTITAATPDREIRSQRCRSGVTGPHSDFLRRLSALIHTFPTTATALGIRPGPEALEIAAPFGIEDLFARIVRPNKARIPREIYAAKTARWEKLWPGLIVIDWARA